MRSYDRLIKTLNHTEPDRIPYDIAGTTVTGITKNAFEKIMKHRDIPVLSEAKDIDPIQQVVTPSAAILEKLNCDVRRIGARRIPDYENAVTKQGEVLEVTDAWGCLWRMDRSCDYYFNQVTWPLEKYNTIGEALLNFKAPSVQDHADIIISDMAEQLFNAGDAALVADRNCAGLTETSLRLRGYSTWFTDTVTDPAGVEKLLDIILQYKIEYWDLVADWINGNKVNVSVVAECDDLGTQTSTLLEPDYLRKIVISRFAFLWARIKKKLPGVKIFMHTCGAVRELLPDLIEAGMDIYNPVQFSAAGMDLARLKRDFGKDIVFWGGGVNTQSTLRNGSPGQVSDEVKRNIDILAPGGGFVFNTVHNIQEDVPPENFWAMWDTLMEHGKY